MTQTFYDVLGVSPDATAEEIEAAYRESIKEVHPDVSDDVDASERAARLNKAKDVLTDESERARYDNLGHETYVSGSSPSATGGGVRTGRGSKSGWKPPGSTTSSAGGVGGRTDQHSSGSDRHTGSADRRPGPGPGDDRGDESPADGDGDPGAWRNGSPSARRQAAASAGSGPNVDDSWNAWDRTRAWAVRQETGGRTGIRPSRLFPSEQSLFLVVMTFFLYPVFVFSAGFPTFPLLARVLVAVCTLLVIVYLLSMPEVAIVIFGLWSVLVPLALLAVPGVGVLSLVGVVGLVATWLPLGFGILTHAVLRPA